MGSDNAEQDAAHNDLVQQEDVPKHDNVLQLSSKSVHTGKMMPDASEEESEYGDVTSHVIDAANLSLHQSKHKDAEKSKTC